MLFAHLKRIVRLAHCVCEAPSGAQFEFTLAAIVQNLRRLAKLSATTDWQYSSRGSVSDFR